MKSRIHLHPLMQTHADESTPPLYLLSIMSSGTCSAVKALSPLNNCLENCAGQENILFWSI